MSTADLRPDLSVIIVNWNVKKQLEACLQSLYEHTQQVSCEVLVVDNASQDGSPEMIAAEFPKVQLLRNPANVGFARANNQAITLSKGRYVLLLNPDTLLHDDALSRMVSFLDHRADIGVLGCKVLTAEGKIDTRCARRFPTLWGELFELARLSYRFPHNRLFGEYLMTYWDHGDSREVDAISGACLMVRRAAIEQVGLLDESFFLYGEDIDWCYRCKEARWKVFYYSEAAIIHLGSQSTQQLEDEMGLERFRSRDQLFRKHRGQVYAWTYKALVFLLAVIKEMIFGMGFLRNIGSEKRDWYSRKIKMHWRVLLWALKERPNLC
jgi:GT2 family glycosyltransferase